MASRTVSVLLTAQVSNYISNLEAARKKTVETAQAAEKTADGLEKQHRAFQTVGTGFAVVGAAAAVAVASVVKVTAEFNAKMAQLKTVSHASKSEMDNLRSAALSAGTAFGYTASQVADAQIELAKAGINAKQQLGGALTGALALAAAGQIEVGKATEIAVTAMTDFKLKASDLPHVADLLAAGADKSTASVESIGQALQQSGLVASQFGLSVEDTVGTLTAFAQAGLQGSDAGTSLKTMLLSLAKPTEQSSKALSEYNIQAYDSQGAFVGVTELASQLQSGLGKLSAEQRNAALATIFGTDAIRSAGVLYDLGGKKLQGFIDANNEAGFASAQAAGKLDSLTGDMQKFNAVVQTDMIKAGSGLEGALRGVVQEASGMVTAFGNLPGPIQSTAVVATGLVAGVGLLGGAFLLAVPKITEFRLALQGLGVSGKGALGIFGKGTGALIGLTAAASALANVGTSGIASAEQIKVAGNLYGQGFKNLNDAFKGDGGFILSGGASHALDAIAGSFLGISQAGAAKALDGLTFGITHFSDVYKSSEGQFAAIGEQLKALAAQDYSGATTSFNTLVTKLGGGTEAAKQALSVMPAYKQALVDMLTASGQAASEQNILAAATGSGGVASKLREAQSAAAANQSALQAMTGGADDAAGAIDELAKQIAGFGSVALDARSAQRAFEAAVDDAASAAKKNGKNLDIATEAGRANQSALDGIASSAVAAASAILKTSGNTDDAAAAIRRGRKAFIDAAVQMGLNRTKAEKLADSLNLIPRNVKTAVSVNGTGAAMSAISDLEARLKALNGRTARVAVIYSQTGKDIATGGARFDTKAAGGAVTGPGPRGVDSVPTLLAPGEHVLTTRDVSALGGQAGVYALRAGLQGYAKGGAIGHTQPVFNEEGPDHYMAAFDFFKKYAKKGSYNTKLTAAEEAKFEQWVAANNVPFDVHAKINDYDMRGYWKKTKGRAWREGDHFPDTYKTPYDTTFSRQSQYATKDNPFDWSGDDLINMKTKQLVFRAASDAPAVPAGGAIGQSKAAEEKAKKQAAMYTRQLAAAKKSADRLQRVYEDIDGTKKNADRKKAAKRAADAADKKVSDLSKKLDTAKETADSSGKDVAKLREARDDFESQQRRGVTDPLSYIDQLRSMSRDDTYSAKNRKKYESAVDKYEKSLSDLTKQSAAAADKLSDLKSSADSMKSSITSAIAGGYQASSATSTASSTGSFFRNGIEFQTTSSSSGAVTAGSLASYYAQGATDTSSFASQLKQLANRGVNGKLLAEIAGYGVAQGAPIAAALLSASDGQIASINSNYAAIQGNAATAAGTVADVNYKALIDAAQTVADGIAKQIADDSAKLRKLIADAFGLKGYASGTTSATTGLHLVGEDGPELMWMGGGERIATAGQSRAWVRGNRYAGGTTSSSSGGGRAVTFNFTDDGSRLGVAMREIAEGAIARDQAEASILEWGGAA